MITENDFTKIWKSEARAKNISARDMFDRCLIKAIRAKTNDHMGVAYALLKKTFSPVTNTTKLQNGTQRWSAIGETSYRAKYAKEKSNFLLFLNDEEFVQYQEMAQKIWYDYACDRMPDVEYCYFFVRQDIFPEYQLVQNSHVALKLGVELGKLKVENVDQLHFVCIGVPDIAALETAAKQIKRVTHQDAVRFIEPDIGDELTAIASFPVKATQKHRFAGYKLLKFNKE